MTRLWRAWIGSMPPLLRPHMRTLAASCIAAIAIPPLAMLLLRPWGAFGFAAAALVPQLFAAHLRRRRRELIRESLERADNLLCGVCGRNLRHIHEPGACPECGTWCRPERLRSFWRRMSAVFELHVQPGWPALDPRDSSSDRNAL